MCTGKMLIITPGYCIGKFSFQNKTKEVIKGVEISRYVRVVKRVNLVFTKILCSMYAV